MATFSFPGLQRKDQQTFNTIDEPDSHVKVKVGWEEEFWQEVWVG